MNQDHSVVFQIAPKSMYASTSTAEEAEAEWFYEDLQDLLELTPKKDVLFITTGMQKQGVKRYLLIAKMVNI